MIELPLASCVALVIFVGCSSNEDTTTKTGDENNSARIETGDMTQTDLPTGDFSLTSAAFQHGDPIPAKYTADGNDVSPPLVWSGAPKGTQQFVLICDDPDAPSRKNPGPKPWVHWILFNVPVSVAELPEGLPRTPTLSGDGPMAQGINSWPNDPGDPKGIVGYRGPSPPPGSGPHRYFSRSTRWIAQSNSNRERQRGKIWTKPSRSTSSAKRF